MRPLRRPLIVVATLTACASPSGLSGRWIGPLTPQPPTPTCPETRGVAQVKSNALIFTPDEGTWILEGTIGPNGAVTATRTRRGANKQPYTTRLTATLTPESLTGTYTTPTCTYAVQLTRR